MGQEFQGQEASSSRKEGQITLPEQVQNVRGCQGCPLRDKFPQNNFVPPQVGPTNRLGVAEAAGGHEAETGLILSGGAGSWLNTFYSKAGVKKSDLNLINVIQCRPPGHCPRHGWVANNRENNLCAVEDSTLDGTITLCNKPLTDNNIFPTDPKARSYCSKAEAESAVSHCLAAHTLPFVKSRDWERVDLLGDKALEYVGGREGIFKWRGSPINIPALGDGLVAIPTLHPAYIARDQEFIPVVINDLRKGLTPPPEYYNLTPSLEDVQAFTAKEVCFDIETKGWSTEITMVGISSEPYKVMVVPFSGRYVNELRRIFRQSTSLIGHNLAQFDIPILFNSLGLSWQEKAWNGQIWDTMLLHHLCFPSLPHDLEFVGTCFTQKPIWKHGKKENEELYCARDVDVTMMAFRQLLPMVRSYGMEDLYKFCQVPLAKICKLMHTTGFKVDPGNIERVRAGLIGKMQQAELLLPEQMRTQLVKVNKRELAPPGTLSPKTGKPIKFITVEAEEQVVPWLSPLKKQAYLYGNEELWQLNLPEQHQIKGEGNVTTDKRALEKLFHKTGNQAIKAMRDLTRDSKLVSTFCAETLTKVSRQYPNFNVHGTASGRLSSSDPNLQNQPEAARYIFVPSHPGWRIAEFDYSSGENRLTAYFAHDLDRLNRFLQDPKFSEHKYAASIFMDLPYAEVEKSSDPESPYKKAKEIVHGTDKGEGSLRISKNNDWVLKDVKILHDKWKQIIKPTIQWQRVFSEEAKRKQHVVTPFGRWRWYYTSSWYTESLGNHAQSVLADMIYRAMIGLMYERIGWPVEWASKVTRVLEPLPQPAQLLLQVHDSLVIEYPPDIEDKVIHAVRSCMEQPFAELGGFSIPVGVKVSDSSWGECEEI